MPGRKDAALPGASFISEWEIYRAGVVANDVLATPDIVTQTIDLSRNDNGMTNQIWVYCQRVSGSPGNITLSLYRENVGSLTGIAVSSLESSQATLVDTNIHKFTGLMAVNYRILVTAITGGASWTLHVAHT